MGMKQTLDALNRMRADGIIGPYAMAGAVAAYRYIEPAVTEDLDILVSFDSRSTLISLTPIFDYLKKIGYDSYDREGIDIEGWPVQFIPATDALDMEALANADDVDIDIPLEGTVTTRVMRPEYLVAVALRVGRPKDQIRIVQFVEEGAVAAERLCDILRRHGLVERWQSFCRRTGMPDPCAVG